MGKLLKNKLSSFIVNGDQFVNQVMKDLLRHFMLEIIHTSDYFSKELDFPIIVIVQIHLQKLLKQWIFINDFSVLEV